MNKTNYKSTKVSLKFLNNNKALLLSKFVDEYSKVVKRFVDILWDVDKIPYMLNKNFTDMVSDSWVSASSIQAAGSQALAIVRGAREKYTRRMFVYNKLIVCGKFRQARKLKKIIDKNNILKPKLDIINPVLDKRFVIQDWDNCTTFDVIIVLRCLGDKLRLVIPIKKTKHFNRLLGLGGKIKPGIRISKNDIIFFFEMPNINKKCAGEVIGLDVGVKNSFTLSSGAASKPDNHGYTLDLINSKLARKVKGSASFRKAQQHRTNYINWSLNQINFNGISKLKMEKIKHLRKGEHSSRKLSHFTYTEIFTKLEDLCATNGVQIEYINPTYTSQRCSKCGWVRSSNRKGKQFKCKACGFQQDADLNAAINIATNLRPIGKAERLLHKNKVGFYWNEVEKEFTVPFAKKL